MNLDSIYCCAIKYTKAIGLNPDDWESLIMQTDLEEAKGHEILKLQNSLQSIHAIVHETYALLTKDKERESAQKAVEEASAIVQETTPIHVEDTEKIDKLSAEVEKLKVMLVTKESESAQKKIYNLSAEVEELKVMFTV